MRASGMILVTGASGYVGRAAFHRLSAMAHPVAAMVRNSHRVGREMPAGVSIRIADYDDKSSLERAFDGVSGLLFVASDGEARAVMRHHANVIDAAAAVGIAHITFTSIIDIAEASPFYFAPVYRDAERRLAECGVPATILRCGLYSDLVLARWLEPARSTGEVSLPLESAAIAPISRDDVAAAAATTAASPSSGGMIRTLTGPAAQPFAEIVEAAGIAFGIPTRYVPCTPAAYRRRASAEMPEPWPQAFSSLCASIVQGRYGEVSSDFETLMGRASESFGSFLHRLVRGGRGGKVQA